MADMGALDFAGGNVVHINAGIAGLIFIVDDDTTGERILMNFEKMKRWKKTKFKIPIMKVFKNDAEIAELIEHNHQTECVRYNDDETLK